MNAIKQCFVCALALSALAWGTTGWAQQKYPLKDAASESKYVEERAIDVGDAPGHQVRIYRIHYTYPQKDFVFLGVPVKESYTSGISDYTNWNGQFTTYSLFVLEDGNTVLARGGGNNQAAPDGRRKFSFVDNFVGGSGKFRGIRGQMRGSGERAPGANSLTVNSTGEYWIEE